MKKMKSGQMYVEPQMEVMEVIVEKGFAASPESLENPQQGKEQGW